MGPRYLYRQIIGDPEAVEAFLQEIGVDAWNLEMDRGLSPAQAIADLTAKFPDRAALITAWKDRWLEMIRDANHDVVALMRRLRDKGVKLYSITNFNQDTFRLAADKYEFLNWLDGIIVSGIEGILKPDPAIYRLLLERYHLDPATLYFTDDRADNVAARAQGFHSDVFTSAGQLEGALRQYDLL